MTLTPRIEIVPAKFLVGMHRRMSMAKVETPLIWQTFMPRRKEILNVKNSFLYSLEVFDDLSYFDRFNPQAEFTKWAAVEVENHDDVPDQMEKLYVPEGRYALFAFRGLAKDAPAFYFQIFSEWLPSSNFELELRPHFALMGEKYKKEDPNSEEDIYIPIRMKGID